MTGDYHRAAWFEDLWNIRNDKLREQTIERLELALNAAASCPIDDGELPQIDNVAGDDDVGLAEEHHDVAVGMRASLPDDLDCIVIDIHRPKSRGECLARPHIRGKR